MEYETLQLWDKIQIKIQLNFYWKSFRFHSTERNFHFPGVKWRHHYVIGIFRSPHKSRWQSENRLTMTNTPKIMPAIITWSPLPMCVRRTLHYAPTAFHLIDNECSKSATNCWWMMMVMYVSGSVVWVIRTLFWRLLISWMGECVMLCCYLWFKYRIRIIYIYVYLRWHKS